METLLGLWHRRSVLGRALIGADKCDRLKVCLAAPVPVGSLHGSDAFSPKKEGRQQKLISSCWRLWHGCPLNV